MKITWIGHSCFKIEKEDYAIVVDPYEDGSVPGLKPVRENADLVLCSHEHADHNFRGGVTLSGRTKMPFSIEKVSTWHDEVKGAKRGNNQIFIIDDGENRIAHLGDLGCELMPDQLQKLRNLDAVMIPVGGFYTIDARQAAELVRRLKPRIVIPMHYRSDRDQYGYDVIGTVDEFTELMDSVTTIPGSEIETASALRAQVVVLQPKNRKLSGK
ncbi:MAG: MBL fold metallo-hydrolase [Lachnospiraceae bacterium]|nr:MBL fold metallo-hydrolase [Lachnospiraceae bacterium]